MSGVRTDQSAYDYEREMLRINLNLLFSQYRGMVEGEQRAALIAVLNTGKHMMNEMHFLYCPPIALDFFLGKMDTQRKDDNYRAVTDMYVSANELISALMEKTINVEKINAAKRKLGTTIELHYSQGERALDTAFRCCSAFYNALITFAGIATMVIGIVLAPTTLGAGLGLTALGLFATGLGATRLVRDIKIFKETGRQAAQDFSDAAKAMTDLTLGKTY